VRVLYFDCFSGVSGDMVLGAALDLGLPLGELRRALGSLALEDCDVAFDRVTRGGIAAGKFRVVTREAHHADHLDHHAHRTLADIVRLIERSALSETARSRAATLFRRLAEVEAGVHQISVDAVHLHEVGALDSIVDIVGAVFALEWLAPGRVVASPLNVGRGTVRTAHGVLPVPAPATARLLERAPIYASGPEMELVTPTGALLVTAYADEYGPMPAMRLERIGYGAGDRDPAGHANVLRLLVGESDVQATVERVVVLECEIDDMNPQIFGVLMDELLAAGALDVFYGPIQMKKNRPGTLVTVIARPGDRDLLSAILFRETTTIGLRYQEMSRERLTRESVAVETPLGPIPFKVARRHGVVVNVAPEFDECARLAASHRMPVKDVQALAMKAYLEKKA
jgi:uncharacterized protein (TIGR00299 family) protein